MFINAVQPLLLIIFFSNSYIFLKQDEEKSISLMRDDIKRKAKADYPNLSYFSHNYYARLNAQIYDSNCTLYLHKYINAV